MTSRTDKNKNLRLNSIKLTLGLILTLIMFLMGLYGVDTARSREFDNNNGRMFFISRDHTIVYIEVFGNTHEVNGRKISNQVSNLLERVQSTFKK